MLTLQLLGVPDLRLEDRGASASILAQPKLLALLTFLALAEPRGYHRRDTLAALLWPEVDQERARNSLRQALHRLRAALGSETIVNRGTEEVGLRPDAVTSDALVVAEAIRAGHPERALAAYRGDLLPGFHLTSAPEFENWLEGERVRLRALALKAARALVQSEAAAGRTTAAAHWAERGLELAPADEELARRRMTLLAQSGDSTGALATYQQFAERLSREFELTPGSGLTALADSIREQARQAPAPVVMPGGAASPDSAAVVVAPGTPGTPGTPPRSRTRVAGLLAGLAVVVLVIALGMWRAKPAGRATDAPTVLILPFRVSGADPALGYLREGMVDLLAAKLTGEGSELRATDPRTVLNAWKRLVAGDSSDPAPAEAIRLAGELGAHRVLLGGVVGRSARLALQGVLYDVPNGAVRARGSAEGPTDSLPELVDQLVAALLAQEAGELAARLPALAGTPLPAVRAYLEGEQAYRGGRYQEAFERYQAALVIDSTFGPAAVGVAAAAIWYPTAEPERQRALRLGWAARGRMGAADRAVLQAIAGPRYPGLSTWRERLAAWEQALAVDPGRPDAWYEYGDILMHRGPLLQVVGSRDLAERAFARAVALDSSFAAPVSHLFDLGAGRGDTTLVEAAATLFLVRDSASDIADYVHWRRAALQGDSRVERLMRQRLVRFTPASLWRIIGVSQIDSLPLDDALLAARALAARPLKRDDQVETLAYLMELALNRGRPQEARQSAEALGNKFPGRDVFLSTHLLNALYAEGDSAAAIRAAARYTTELHHPPPASGEERADYLWKSCALAQWRGWQGDTTGLAQTIVELRRREGTDLPWWAPENFALCAAVLDALRATDVSEPSARLLVQRLDSLTLTGPDVDVRDPATVALARLWSRLGEPGRALDAIRRRQYHHRTGLPYLAVRLKEEGRYALAVGDSVAARAAWHRVLLLQSQPEASRQKSVDEIRIGLARLGP